MVPWNFHALIVRENSQHNTVLSNIYLMINVKDCDAVVSSNVNDYEPLNDYVYESTVDDSYYDYCNDSDGWGWWWISKKISNIISIKQISIHSNHFTNIWLTVLLKKTPLKNTAFCSIIHSRHSRRKEIHYITYINMKICHSLLKLLHLMFFSEVSI